MGTSASMPAASKIPGTACSCKNTRHPDCQIGMEPNKNLSKNSVSYLETHVLDNLFWKKMQVEEVSVDIGM